MQKIKCIISQKGSNLTSLLRPFLSELPLREAESRLSSTEGDRDFSLLLLRFSLRLSGRSLLRFFSAAAAEPLRERDSDFERLQTKRRNSVKKIHLKRFQIK